MADKLKPNSDETAAIQRGDKEATTPEEQQAYEDAQHRVAVTEQVAHAHGEASVAATQDAREVVPNPDELGNTMQYDDLPDVLAVHYVLDAVAPLMATVATETPARPHSEIRPALLLRVGTDANGDKRADLAVIVDPETDLQPHHTHRGSVQLRYNVRYDENKSANSWY